MFIVLLSTQYRVDYIDFPLLRIEFFFSDKDFRPLENRMGWIWIYDWELMNDSYLVLSFDYPYVFQITLLSKMFHGWTTHFAVVLWGTARIYIFFSFHCRKHISRDLQTCKLELIISSYQYVQFLHNYIPI